jgi:hypothetical protein
MGLRDGNFGRVALRMEYLNLLTLWNHCAKRCDDKYMFLSISKWWTIANLF